MLSQLLLTCSNYSLLTNQGVVNEKTLLKQVTAHSLDACCGACTALPTCAAFTFSPVHFTCRMTATPSLHGPVANVTSGSNSRLPTMPPTVPPSVCIPVHRPPAPAPSTVPRAQRPHFVSLLIDDLGFDDLRTHDIDPSSHAFTPNAEALMREGVKLNRHHSYMWCSPTRRSFITGRYPVHITGIQAGTNTNLTPLQFTILPEKLAAADYESHFIGKGHLGWHTTDHLLVNRGFTSHVGYLGGSQSYECGGGKTGMVAGACPADWTQAHDMWHNETPGFDVVPEIHYSTNYYSRYAVERIEVRDTTKPMWLHVAFQAMHGGAHRGDVPAGETLPVGTNFRSPSYGNALTALDDAIGNITAALKSAKMWENTLLFIIADNGGDNPGGAASNYPLVGRKCLSWEGGTRVYALAAGGLIPAARRGTTSEQLMHISDWYATFSVLAGVSPVDKYVDPSTNTTHDVDGVNIFPSILSASAKTRVWLPTTHKSLLWDQTTTTLGGHLWKLIQGNETQAKRFYSNGSTYDDPFNACLVPIFNTFDCVNSRGVGGGGGRSSCVVCTNKEPCLFDVATGHDESETKNVAHENPAVVKTMQAKLLEYAEPYVPLALTPGNLHCYDCDFVPAVQWKNFTGPGCIRK